MPSGCPPILGWLVAGMVLGPHLLNVFSQPLMDSLWYTTLEHILECTLGLMIGTELPVEQAQAGRPADLCHHDH